MILEQPPFALFSHIAFHPETIPNCVSPYKVSFYEILKLDLCFGRNLTIFTLSPPFTHHHFQYSVIWKYYTMCTSIVDIIIIYSTIKVDIKRWMEIFNLSVLTLTIYKIVIIIFSIKLKTINIHRSDLT